MLVCKDCNQEVIDKGRPVCFECASKRVFEPHFITKFKDANPGHKWQYLYVLRSKQFKALYVGKTITPCYRFYQHLIDPRKEDVRFMEILWITNNKKDIFEVERANIWHHDLPLNYERRDWMERDYEKRKDCILEID